MRVTIFGSGYVGLVGGACLAETGNEVVCADVDAGKVARLQAGEVPIYEPGLEALVRRNAAEGRLRFTTDLAEAVRHGEVLFIAVGTPPGEDGSADLSREKRNRRIGPNLSPIGAVTNGNRHQVSIERDVEELVVATPSGLSTTVGGNRKQKGFRIRGKGLNINLRMSRSGGLVRDPLPIRRELCFALLRTGLDDRKGLPGLPGFVKWKRPDVIA